MALPLSIRKPPGFTLVELVAVIAIVATLAISLAPRLGSIESTARHVMLKNFVAQLQAANHRVFAAAAVKRLDRQQDASLMVPDGVITLRFGFPNHAELAAFGGQVLTINPRITISTGSAGVGFRMDGRNTCAAIYRQPAGVGQPPTISVTSTGC